MGTYKYMELTSCVKNELIELKFNGVERMYCALLTQEEYNAYTKDCSSVKRHLHTSPIYFRAIEADKLFLVHDLNGQDISTINGWVRRFAPDFTPEEAQNNSSQGVEYVQNAHDTDADDSMIQYWKDHQDKKSKLDLYKSSFICPSCRKSVSVDTLNGAHVRIVNNTHDTLYITPTCETCNKSKVNRIFKVDAVDLIKAPED